MTETKVSSNDQSFGLVSTTTGSLRKTKLKARSTCPLSSTSLDETILPQTIPFFTLAPELRNLIYEYLFTLDTAALITATIDPPSSNRLSLLLVCRTTYCESCYIAYHTTVFHITSSPRGLCGGRSYIADDRFARLTAGISARPPFSLNLLSAVRFLSLSWPAMAAIFDNEKSAASVASELPGVEYFFLDCDPRENVAAAASVAVLAARAVPALRAVAVRDRGGCEDSTDLLNRRWARFGGLMMREVMIRRWGRGDRDLMKLKVGELKVAWVLKVRREEGADEVRVREGGGEKFVHVYLADKAKLTEMLGSIW